MTIEEAIVQLKDLRKDREGFLANDETDSEFAKDIEAIDMALEHIDLNGTYISMNTHNKLYEKQKSINYELVDENQEFINENKELKRLLRLALNDFEFIYDEHSCTGVCECDTFCPYNMEKNRCLGKWQHAEEALKLLGDDADD